MKLKEIRQGLKNHLRLYQSLYHDSRTPRLSRILLWLALGYFFLPFDLIPDFIPVIGQLDDALIIPGLIFLALKMIPRPLYQEHYTNIFSPDN
ncbi:MAG: YkvA family protein [Dehalogenimonas sp.]